MIEQKKNKRSLKLSDKKIVRTYSAGVFYGNLKSRNGKEGIMTDVMCLWYWKGAASLLQLALEGVKEPKECKFTVRVPKIELSEIIEVIEQPHQVLCTIMYKGKEALIPVHEASLLKLDKKNRKVYLDLPEGLLEIYE